MNEREGARHARAIKEQEGTCTRDDTHSSKHAAGTNANLQPSQATWALVAMISPA